MSTYEFELINASQCSTLPSLGKLYINDIQIHALEKAVQDKKKMWHFSHMYLAFAGLINSIHDQVCTLRTLNNFLTISGEDSQGCMQNGCFILTEFGGNSASKSAKSQVLTKNCSEYHENTNYVCLQQDIEKQAGFLPKNQPLQSEQPCRPLAAK